jgi:DNA-binding NtrC family response regulator
MATVLLIGADPVTRLILEQAGHTVSMADSFTQVLENLSHTGAEVVLTDLHMPDSESLRLIAQLHTEFPLVKILVILGEHETVDFLAVRMIGANDVLRQPLATKTLLDAVEQALGEGDAS